MRIEVYLEIEKAVIKGNTPYGPSPWSIRRRFGSREDSIFTVKESFSDLSPKEKAVIDTVQDYANAHGIEYRVYDISKLRGGLRALFKGVREAPTVIIGKEKFAGNVTACQIGHALGKR